jgi:hypothetical protein
MVQNALGYVASLAEAIKNTFNFSVPFLSWLAVAILVGVTLVLYFISLRSVSWIIEVVFTISNKLACSQLCPVYTSFTSSPSGLNVIKKFTAVSYDFS